METITEIEIERKWVPTEPCIQLHGTKRRAELPTFLQMAYPRLYQFASGKAVPGMPFARFHNWNDEQVDCEAGVIVNRALEGEGSIMPGKFGGHEALVATHVGPYSKAGEVYAAMHEYMKQHELQPGGAPYEVYLNSPERVSESELKTEVYWPIR